VLSEIAVERASSASTLDPTPASPYLEVGEAVADLPDALRSRDDAQEQDLVFLDALL
jgi:hypothetical protein